MRVAVFAICFALAALPLRAGPWPRDPGSVFASASVELTYNLETLLYAQYNSIYAEVGVTPYLTFGLDVGQNLIGDVSGFAFLRVPVGYRSWRNRFAVLAGYGTYEPHWGETESLIVYGASWGRGFDTRWGSGWVTAEAQMRRRSTSGDINEKVDLTIGLKPWDRWTFIGKLNYDAFTGVEDSYRFNPAVVFKLRKGIKLEAGALIDLQSSDNVGVKLGTWLEF